MSSEFTNYEIKANNDCEKAIRDLENTITQALDQLALLKEASLKICTLLTEIE